MKRQRGTYMQYDNTGRPGKLVRKNAPNKRYAWPRKMNNSPRIIAPSMDMKGVDVNITAAGAGVVLATVTTNVDVIPLNLITPGNGSFNRIGRKVKLQNVVVELSLEHVYFPAATTANLNGNFLRCALVWDRQPNGVIPTYDSIFGVTDQSGNETTNYFDPIKYDTRERFRIIRDEKITFDIQSNAPTAGTNNNVINYKHIKMYARLPFDCLTNYSGQSNPCTIADISSGALYITFRSAINSASNIILVRGGSFARLKYFDQ